MSAGDPLLPVTLDDCQAAFASLLSFVLNLLQTIRRLLFEQKDVSLASRR